MRKKLMICFTLLFFCAAARAWQADDAYEFAESLYEDADYYRAIGEYKRYIFISENGHKTPKALFKIGMSYLNAERWDEAMSSFENIEMRFSGKTAERAMLARSLSLQKKRDFNFSKSINEAFLDSRSRDGIGMNFYYLNAWNYIYEKEWNAARIIFEEIDGGVFGESSAQIAERLKISGNIPQKSPVLGGILAAVLPGSGHLYSGKLWEGFTSMLMSGYFIYRTYEAFSANNNLDKVLFGAPAVVFYGSNIYGSINAAHRFNAAQTDGYIRHLEGLKVDVLTFDY
ncbi:MAG: tetratricopeptide repeat protein [bacterium]